MLSAFEAGAYLLGKPFSVVASRIWLIHGFLAVGFLCAETFQALREDGRRRNFLALAALAALAFVALDGIGSVQRFAINHEATQEAGQGMAGWKEPDLGYTRTGFISYPFRQYLLVSLPSLPQGPSVPALRLGFALPLLLGGAVFQGALRRRLHPLDPSGALAALGTFFLLSSPYLLDWVKAWEQTLLPVSFVLLALGALLYAEEQTSAPRLFSLIWAGALLGTSYTPALAGWALILVLVAVNGFSSLHARRREDAVRWFCAFVPIAVFGGLSFLTRGDVFKSPSTYLPAGRLLDAVRVASFGPPHPFLHEVVAVLLVVWIILVVTGRAEWRHILYAGWCAAAFASAVLLRGYASPSVSFVLHRAMVALPVMVLGSATTLAPLLAGRFRPWMAWPVALLLTATTPLAWRADPAGRRGRAADDAVMGIVSVLGDLQLGSGKPFPVVLATRYPGIDNLSDYLQYFAPAAQVTKDCSILWSPPAAEDVLAIVRDEAIARRLQAEGWELRGVKVRPFENQGARLFVGVRRVGRVE